MEKGLGTIRTLGDPVLKERANRVTAFDEKLERLAGLMTEVMQREDGVGLAATQLGVLCRLIVWRHPENEDELFANPEITECSDSCTIATEGCLSVPGASVEVSRPDEVVVAAQDLKGASLEMRLTDLLARIVQHEIDHLDGRLILDRATPEERRRVLKELREQALAEDT
jgi:peptide deformylase